MKHLIFLLQASGCIAFTSLASPSKVVVSARTQIGIQLNGRQSLSLSSSSNNGNGGVGGFLEGIFSQKSSAVVKEPEPQIPDFVVDTDYTLAAVFAVVGVSVIALTHGVGGIIGGGFITLLASLFAVQASRLRFVFDKDCFELMSVNSIGSDELQDSGENIVVGGANRWAYSSFVNWDFFPSLDVPILVYFKESQTSKDDGSEPGQIHFFPAIANCKQLKEQFELRECASVERS